MKTMDIIRRAGRNLSQAKLRTIFTALAISIGAFVIMTSLAFGVGINNYTDSLIGTNINDRSISVSKGGTDDMINISTAGSGLREYSENYNDLYRMELLDKNDIDKLKKVSSVERVFAYQIVNMKYFTIEGQDKKWSSSINAFDPLVVNESIAGQIPQRGQSIDDQQIIIPEDYLSDLGPSAQDIVGKKLTMTFSLIPTQANINTLELDPQQITPETLTNLETVLEKQYEFDVIAVSKNVPMSLSGSQLLISENRYFEISQTVNQDTENDGKYIQLVATLKEGIKPEDGKAAIEKQTGLKATTARELQQLPSQMTNILQIIVIAFGILSLLVSVFGIINTLYVSVLERTSQIGLMKALGMRGKHVAKLFRYEAAWIGFIGGAVGTGLSWIIGNLLNPWISELVGFKPEDQIYLLQYRLIHTAVLITILVIIATASSLLPARKAAKLDPIEALKTE